MEVYEKALSIQKVIDYIENHLKEPITLHQLAKASDFSPCYVSRLFKELMGVSAFDYIRHRRMTEAAKILGASESKVIDVAMDFVFDSHEGFTRAFSKTFGLSPKQYMKHKPPIPYYLPYSIKEYHAYLANKVCRSNIPEVCNVFVQLLKKPRRKVLLKRGRNATHYFEYCEEVGCDVWGLLISVKNALSEPMGMWFPPELRPEETSMYVQGVEVPLSYEGPIPNGYALIELEPCDYLVFQGPTYLDEAFSLAIEALWSAISRYDPILLGYQWAPHKAPKIQLEPQGYRGYIEMHPVSPINA